MFGPDDLTTRLRTARHVVVLTGAGVSADSGVPTFRDAQTGLWAKYDPAQLASPEAFAHDPQRVTQWYDHRRQLVLRCEPNPAHHALAELERWLTDRGARSTLLTQNVDRLHQRAGSRAVHEMHGTLLRWRCTQCAHEQLEENAVPFDQHPPRCTHCGGHRRPCVVWFGEMLPFDALQAADGAIADCDTFLCIGTSAVVYPVADYIQRAVTEPDVMTCEVNPVSTALTAEFDFVFNTSAAHALPPLVKAAMDDDSSAC